MDENECVDSPHGVKVPTAYGQRRTCSKCRRRWTRLYVKTMNGDTEMVTLVGVPWVEEKYSPMRDNCHG